MLSTSVKNLSSQLTQCKLTWNLMVSSFWSRSSTSQCIHEMISQLWPPGESPVSCISHRWACCDLFVRSTVELSKLWQQCDHYDLTINLTVTHSWWVHCELALAHIFTGNTDKNVVYILLCRSSKKPRDASSCWVARSRSCYFHLPCCCLHKKHLQEASFQKTIRSR